MRNKILFNCLIAMLIVSAAISQPLNSKKLDSLFDLLNVKNKAMGSVAIVKNGQTLYTRAIGYSAISGTEKVQATSMTKYRIGSITKMFTAVMIFQLIEEGKLKLATTLDTYFPQIPNAKMITIGNMLNHRSGIHNFTDDDAYETWNVNAKTADEMVAIIAKNPSDFAPDTKGSYSNSNYVLLGMIVEKISKKTYAAVLTEQITSKLGLQDTYYGGKTDIKKNESYSYEFADGWHQKSVTDMSIPGGAGAIVSTATDLAKFIDALFNHKLISDGNLSKMKTITDGYGMGMFQFPFDEKKGYGHTGGIDAFSSMLVYFPEDSLSVGYTTNGQVYAMNNILLDVLSTYYDRPWAMPVFSELALQSTDLDKYLGTYSTSQLPLKVTFTKQGNILIAQPTGQPSFPMEPSAKDIFTFEQAGVKVIFNPAQHQFTLEQGGASIVFTKE